MRVLRFFIVYALVTILGLLLLAFLVLNHGAVELNLLASQYAVSLAWIMLGAAIFGFAITLLLLLPVRVAAAVNTRRAERDLRDIEEQCIQLQDWRERALAQHESLLQHHERMLLRYQRLVTEHREIVHELDRVRIRLATNETSRAVQTVSPPATRELVSSRTPRVTAPKIPVTLSPSLPISASVAHPADQPPTILHREPEEARDRFRLERAESLAIVASSATSTPVRAVVPSSATSVTAPNPYRVRVIPVLSATPSSPKPPIVVLPNSNVLPTDYSRMPLDSPDSDERSVTAPALRRPLERLLAEVRHGRQGAESLGERLSYRVGKLRVRVEAGVKAQLARIQQRDAVEDSKDSTDHSESSQTD